MKRDNKRYVVTVCGVTSDLEVEEEVVIVETDNWKMADIMRVALKEKMENSGINVYLSNVCPIEYKGGVINVYSRITK